MAQNGKTAEKISEIASSINLSKVAAEAFNDLAIWRELMPTFESSVSLLEVLEKILELVPKNQETAAKVSRLATEILSKRWPLGNVSKVSQLIFYAPIGLLPTARPTCHWRLDDQTSSLLLKSVTMLISFQNAARMTG